MATLVMTIMPCIKSGGGPITSDAYIGDGSSTWKKGQLLKLADGAMAVCRSLAGSGVLTTTELPAAGKYFIALKDQDAATSGFVKVQEITRDTVFEGQLCAASSGSTIAAQTSVGDKLAGYQLITSGIWGIDVDGTSTTVFQIVGVPGNLYPFDPDTGDAYDRVWFKMQASELA